MEMYLQKIETTYKKIKKEIEETLNNLSKNSKRNELAVFKELLFCLLTPQSKAEKAWNIIENLERENLILDASEDILRERLRDVRFRINKAGYIKKAQETFVKNGKPVIKGKLEKFKDPRDARMWLVKNVKGLGMKEASHFLRNIGKGENLTILDRHILRALKKLNVIEEIPKTLTQKRYLQIESKMEKLVKKLNIPLAHLDFVLWQIETGRIFK